MNRTPNTTGQTNAKSTPQQVSNYAQAVKRSSQNLDTQQRPKSSSPAPSTTPSPPPAVPVAPVNDSTSKTTNGDSRLNGSPATRSPAPTAQKVAQPPSFAAALAKNASSNVPTKSTAAESPQSELVNAQAQNTSSSASATPLASAPAQSKPRQASVQLPRAPPSDAAPIQFGSINQPGDASIASLPVEISEVPVLFKTEVTFGSLPATESPVSLTLF
ncbi:hypothetical protein J3Q64DRAFT_1143281 [Phycomyces blakesleeanus]|uniref:Uncharacterized protein n=1 Tax=Phycomyces blakesleeanus TaxID=4837 RepID=A0ABR3AVW7_PHYBL